MSTTAKPTSPQTTTAPQAPAGTTAPAKPAKGTDRQIAAEYTPGTESTVVGKVLGTEGASPFEWFVAIEPDAYLQVGDVVQVTTQVPGLNEPLRISGVVNNVKSLYEGAKFEGDVFLVTEGMLPVQVARSAHIRTTRVQPELWVPPQPGDTVVRAGGAAREEALYFDSMDRHLAAGLTRDGQPFYIDYDFLCGSQGGHMNISGVSGVATKTTYACFALYSMFAGRVLGREAPNTKAIIFNVKGEDLLFLDKPNAKLKPEDREKYQRLGLPTGPFPSVGIFAPVRKNLNAGAAPVPESTSRQQGVTPYFWTIRDIVVDRLLHFMFAEATDAQSQVSDLALRVEAMLARECREHPTDASALLADDGNMQTKLVTYTDLRNYIEQRLDADASWTGGAAQGTVSAFVRRLNSAEMHLGHMIRANTQGTPASHRISWEKQVTVIDISKLHDRAKRFVVGVILTTLFRDKEDSGEAVPIIYIVLDELNKSAPRDGWSPIKDV
jgi:hypothetical protein